MKEKYGRFAIVQGNMLLIDSARFGEETVQRMVDFVENELESASIFPKNPSVLDVGTYISTPNDTE